MNQSELLAHLSERVRRLNSKKYVTESIRDVIAFPKTQRGQDLMVDAPTPVTEKQLRELHVKLRNVQVAG